MTDNEIIKALECCDNCFCEECSYKPKLHNCREELCHDAVDLINRQKAEINRLNLKLEAVQEAKDQIEKDVFNAEMNLDGLLEHISKAKSEAIRGFAERLKKTMISTRCDKSGYCHYVTEDCEIDNLVKEMVGDGDD